MSKYLDSSGVQQLWKAITNADDAVQPRQPTGADG